MLIQFVAGMCLLLTTADQSQVATALEPQVRQLVHHSMKQWHFPGVAVVVIDRGQVVLLESFGLRDVVQKLPMTVDTLSGIGSLTKAFTGFAAEKLAGQGRLSWASPVRAYMPEFDLQDARANSATLVDLASHRTGHTGQDELWALEGHEVTTMHRDRHLTVSGEFGTYNYSSIMYMTLGHVVATVAQRPWTEYPRQEVLEPLGMSRTVFSLSAAQQDANHAESYHLQTPNGEPLAYANSDTLRKNESAGGSMQSSARDLSRWLQFQLTSSRAVKRLHEPKVIIPNNGLHEPLDSQANQLSYGLGWVISQHENESIVYHHGLRAGFRANITLLPQRQSGFVILTNGNSLDGVVALQRSLLQILPQ
jgi:CubicO group peptidase (beta-lactamase class C family)